MPVVALAIVIVLFLALLALIGGKQPVLRTEIIRDYERGLLYSKGVQTKILTAGQYRLWRSQSITRVDMRTQVLYQGAQEVTTADGISVKLTLGGSYRITDAALSVNAAVNPLTLLYQEGQRAVRSAVLAAKLEDLLADRGALDAAIFTATAASAPPLGFELVTLAIRDVILSGELKRSLAAPTFAQREGLAALERARGETAALRNLANAARLIQEQPGLLQLRALQSVEQGESNTIVLGVADKGLVPVTRTPE